MLPGLTDLRSNVRQDRTTTRILDRPDDPAIRDSRTRLRLGGQRAGDRWRSSRPFRPDTGLASYLGAPIRPGSSTSGPLPAGAYLVRAIIDPNHNRAIDHARSGTPPRSPSTAHFTESSSSSSTHDTVAPRIASRVGAATRYPAPDARHSRSIRTAAAQAGTRSRSSAPIRSEVPIARDAECAAAMPASRQPPTQRRARHDRSRPPPLSSTPTPAATRARAEARRAAAASRVTSSCAVAPTEHAPQARIALPRERAIEHLADLLGRAGVAPAIDVRHDSSGAPGSATHPATPPSADDRSRAARCRASSALLETRGGPGAARARAARRRRRRRARHDRRRAARSARAAARRQGLARERCRRARRRSGPRCGR